MSQGYRARQHSRKHRMRIRQACEPCRKRKRKCNGLSPCNQCTEYEYRCRYFQEAAEAQTISQQLYSKRMRDFAEPQVDKPVGEQIVKSKDEHVNPCASSPEVSSLGISPDLKTGLAVVHQGKGRFSFADSSIVFPRKLGQEMNLPKDLKFHSYGWNLSLRPELRSSVSPAVRRYLTYQDVSLYGQVYFTVVNPVYQLIDRQRFFDQCATYWLSEKPDLDDIEALICGVVALGSFFSAQPSSAENQLVQHAKEVLDAGCAYAPGRLSLNQAAAWVLRTLYLRLTTRPLLSWYASCAAIHVVEAMGLHVHLESVDIAADTGLHPQANSVVNGRNTFECATFLNAIVSAEYGRSRIFLQGLNRSSTDSDKVRPRSLVGQLAQLMFLAELESGLETRRDILQSICNLPDQPPVLVLLKTDVAIHLYRKAINTTNKRFFDAENQLMLSIIRTGLSTTMSFVPDRQPWWNLLSTPFQSLLILISMNSNESLALIPKAMSVLMAVHEKFNTFLVVEVIQTAKQLIKGLERRKLEQAGLLSNASGMAVGIENPSMAAEGQVNSQQAQTLFDAWVGDELDWSLILDGNCPSNYPPGGMHEFI
jgi:Fungal Zn(2)-Cys(6) binuclear cluster domain/Fungal specific transcription factor domain